MNNPKTEEIVEFTREYANTLRFEDPTAMVWLGHAADRLEEFERAMSRLGQFGKLFLDYDGCPRGARGRMGNATLIDNTLSMEPITDVDGNKWIPVQEEALRELCEAVQPRWISVTERLPSGWVMIDADTDYRVPAEYLVHVKGCEYATVAHCIDGVFTPLEQNAWFEDPVAHWRELPEPPKEDENESNPD